MNDNAKQYSKELLKPAPKHFTRRIASYSYINDIWSADLVDYGAFIKANSGFRYLLCIIDLYSRYAFVFPLKSKTSKSILDCFKRLTSHPDHLWVDQGSEFLNKSLVNFVRIKELHYITLLVTTKQYS